jgi:hypothetical protein
MAPEHDLPSPAPSTLSAAPLSTTLLPPAPAYGRRSVAEVLGSAAASIGVDGFENRRTGSGCRLPGGFALSLPTASGAAC